MAEHIKWESQNRRETKEKETERSYDAIPGASNKRRRLRQNWDLWRKKYAYKALYNQWDYAKMVSVNHKAGNKWDQGLNGYEGVIENKQRGMRN